MPMLQSKKKYIKAEFSDMEKRRLIKKVSYISLVANAFLTAAKFIIGIIYINLSVISDGIHSLSDILTTVLVIIAAVISTAPSDKNHNYGHEKLEPVMTKILAVILFATGAFLLIPAVKEIITPVHRSVSIALIVVTAASIVIKELLFHYTIRYSKKLNSLALKADAWHHRTDSFSSIAVLLGLAGNAIFKMPYFESAATIVVALLILVMSIEIYISSVKQVVDMAVSENVLTDIKNIITDTKGVRQIDELKTRISGGVVYVDTEIAVDSQLTVCEGHEIAENVHITLEASPHNIKHVTVHINPFFPPVE